MKITIANKKRFYFIAALVVLLVSGIVAGIYYYNELKNPKDLFKPPFEETVDVNNQFDDSKINVLFFGLDKNEYRDEVEQYGVYRSDTIMLATLDFEKNTVDILSIPRDTYMPIYNTSGKDKVNSCFSYAGNHTDNKDEVIPMGAEYLSKTLSSVLADIPINYYVGITDMNVVNEIIDEIGGIEIDVLYTLYADKGKDKSEVVVEKGLQNLDGEQLQYYARYRAYPLGDIDRVKNQQHIVKTLFSSLKSTNTLVKIPQIYKLVSENITTNLTMKQITALALFAKDVESLETYTMPGDFGDLGGISYWIIDQDERVELIRELFGLEAELMMQDDLSDRVTHLKASVNHSTLKVGDTTNLFIRGSTANGQQHNYDVNDTKHSQSKGGIVQINEDNTIVAKAPGQVRLTFTVEGVSASVNITVQQPVITEPEQVEPKDTIAPTFTGVENTQITQGQAFDAKANVTIHDDDKLSQWSVDGNYDVNTPGVYELTYKAWDTSGNQTVVKRVLTVIVGTSELPIEQ